jgi:putative acyl-CoA dehydrogenase
MNPGGLGGVIMRDSESRTDLATHEVTNQSGPLGDYDAWATDTPLREAVAREGPPWVPGYAAGLGASLGRRYWFEQGDKANRFPPALQAFDPFGRRCDYVDYHPAYHALMGLACDAGAHSVAWTSADGGHVAHAAALYLLTQPEQGFCCPLVMTHAAVPALRCDARIAADWVPRLLANAYDPRDCPARDKLGATVGMAMTEKQGGSDLRANTTEASTSGDGVYELTGHKWFCSAPMSDAFLTLAHTEAGLTCFLLPRHRPQGGRNRLLFQRLKDKCGNRSNASAELELDRAMAQRLGAEGDGIRTIIQMVHETRLDTAIAPVGMLRQALVQVYHHTRHRRTFGRTLIEQPLMREVLADLALEHEASLALVMRLARAFDQTQHSDHERLVARLGAPVAKYWTNKRAPQAIYEAMECLGGNGYIEESLLRRLYREAPVNSIWEGSGNIVCLDVLRAVAKEPAVVSALMADLAPARGRDSQLDQLIERIEAGLSATLDTERRARGLVEAIALAWQGALLLIHGDEAVARGFCQARLCQPAFSYGGAAGDWDPDAILARLWPR